MKKKLSLNERVNSIFTAWRDEALSDPNMRRLLISPKGKGDHLQTIVLNEKELKEFIQCYTDDPESEFYFVRKQFPVSWFVASDVLIDVHANGKIYWVKGSDDKHGRIKHKIRLDNGKPVNLSLGQIRNIVFNENVSEDARMLLKEGFVGVVQHHKEGLATFKEGQSERNNERKNKNIQTITEKEHEMINCIGRNKRIWEDDPEKSMKIMKRLGELSVGKKKVGMVYERIDKTTGRVIEQGYIDI